MNKNIELLNFIHQNAEMGTTSLKQLIEMIDNSEFKSMLQNQYDEYSSIFNESEKTIKSRNEDVKSTGAIKKIESYLMINVKTMMDKTPDNLAGMLMQGSLMGIIQVTRRLKQFKNQVDENVYSLGEKLLKTEENNLEECKKFLG